MKYCCSRPIFGISYGCLTLSLYGMGIFASIFLLTHHRFFVVLDGEFSKTNTTLHGGMSKGTIQALLSANLIYCLVMYAVTGLLIAAIIKKLPKLVLPWMALSVANIMACVGYGLYLFLGPGHDIWYGSLAIIAVVAQVLIAGVIYLLFRDLTTEYRTVAVYHQ